ncbi:hypothetical protein [Frankia sp. ACN1ag]|uniref:hypothetical protein n=1 Tax=Frankia sp. ACN1ag TaxID=102891 RepID=UPI0006DC0D32|nr:hypothetical protein [Frankia sp. ACN1ag]KQC34736.1 hypothetical protein UK82_30455 [Frankia sp. ACN1ag]
MLGGLVYATISTISWTPLRGEAADTDLIILTSDGVHKPLSAARIGELAERYAGDAQALVDALVDTAVAATCSDPDDNADNATAAVLSLVDQAAEDLADDLLALTDLGLARIEDPSA